MLKQLCVLQVILPLTSDTKFISLYTKLAKAGVACDRVVAANKKSGVASKVNQQIKNCIHVSN